MAEFSAQSWSGSTGEEARLQKAIESRQRLEQSRKDARDRIEASSAALATDRQKLQDLLEALPFQDEENSKASKAEILQLRESIAGQEEELRQLENSEKESSKKLERFVPDIEADDGDIVESALGNPGVQAAIAAIGMAYPVAGLVIQGAIAINNWLSGEKDKKIGAKTLERAQDGMRRLDREVSETRHQRELLKIEQIVANDEVQRVLDRRDSLNLLKRAYQHQSDRQIQLRRYHYHKLWSNLEILSYQLYILQRAFEYEFDTSLEDIFSRWPQLDRFRPLLELSPGVITGEFSRTNVIQDLHREWADLEELPNTIQLLNDLAIESRYRDKTTLSLKADFSAAWDDFKRSKSALLPLKFSTNLQRFSGVMLQGRSMRHSFKIESVRVTPRLRKPEQRDITVIDRALESSETANSVYAPSRMREHLEDESNMIRLREWLLVYENPDRLKMVLFHSGIGQQIDERGYLQTIEWGPQAADSNLGVVDPDQHYNLAEGLTPATDWTLMLDQHSALTGDCFEDIEIEIRFTYARHEENSRHIYQYVNQGGAGELESSLEARFNERILDSEDRDPLLARVVTNAGNRARRRVR